MNPTDGPNAADSSTDEVVQVWRRGYVASCIYGGGVLIGGGVYAVFIFSVGRPPVSEIVTAAIVLAMGILIIFNGFYRKATLGQKTLVLRNLFGTTVVPLGDITEIDYPGAHEFHIIDETSVELIWGAKRRSITTRAFGGVWWSAADQIKVAAAAQGAKIIGYNAERKRWDPATGRDVPPSE